MKKVCIITAARSEYGLLKWVIDGVYRSKELSLQLVVTGAHLSPEQGLTYKFIEEDGFPIAEKTPMLLSSNDEVGAIKSMGVCSISMADTFSRLKPDMVVVLGDRYELIPITSAALLMRIPIAHIGGGDITEGAIDDEVRNAVTMMADLHFPGTVDSANNIIRMRGTGQGVFTVGEPGLDSFTRETLWDKEKTAQQLNLDLSKRWCLVTLHPETKLSMEQNCQMVDDLCETIAKVDNCQFVITKANTDVGGALINDRWDVFVNSHRDNMQVYASLGHLRYLSLMKHVDLLVGNSSSGIVEAPFLGTPVVNIGDRQKGRHICSNVICCGRQKEDVEKAIDVALHTERKADYYWGDGQTSERIVKTIKKYLKR